MLYELVTLLLWGVANPGYVVYSIYGIYVRHTFSACVASSAIFESIDTIDYVTGIGNALYCAIKNAGTLRVMPKTNNLPRLGGFGPCFDTFARIKPPDSASMVSIVYQGTHNAFFVF